MSIHRYKSTWRSITFNDRFDNTGLVDDPAHLDKSKVGNDYYLDTVDINRVSVQDYRELRQFLEGAEPNEAFEGVRAITGSGRITAPDYGTLEDKAWALNEAFSVAAVRVAASTADPKGVLPYSFRRAIAGGGSRQLRYWCRPGPGRPIWIARQAGGLIRPFSFQLIAFDPFAYDETETQASVALGGGNVTNPGNIYTKPRIRLSFSGAGNAALTITNSTTGQSLVINATTAGAGDVWWIDVATSKLYNNFDGTSRYSQRVSGYLVNLFLVPGVNAIAFANTGGLTSVRFDFRGAYA